MNSSRRFNALLVPISGGLLMALCYPLVLFTQRPINESAFFALIAFIAPAFFFTSLHASTPKARFVKGFVFAFIWYALMLYWITHSMIYFGNLSYTTSILILLLLVCYLSLYPAVWAWLFDRFGSGWRRVLLGSAVWVLLEYISTYFLTGFPWCLIGYSVGNMTLLIQPADLFGIHGLSFLVVAMNLLLLECRRSANNRYIPRLAYIVMLALWLSYGVMAKKHSESIVHSATSTPRITVLQGNIAQDQKWSSKARQSILEAYLQMTEVALPTSDLIVWPEASYPYSMDYQTKQLPYINFRGMTSPPLLLIGVPTHIAGTKQIMNSMMSVTPDGQVMQRYDKIHLVLYGEFIPFADFLPIKKLTQGLGNFTSGKEIVPTVWQNGSQQLQAGPLICYEVIYPDLARRYAHSGSGLLINITNDAWFGTTSGPFQHLNIARFRAVENRLAIARAANTGITAFITPNGEISSSTQLDQRVALTAAMPYLTSTTLYSRYGDWPLLTLLILALICLPTAKNSSPNDR